MYIKVIFTSQPSRQEKCWRCLGNKTTRLRLEKHHGVLKYYSLHLLIHLSYFITERVAYLLHKLFVRGEYQSTEALRDKGKHLVCFFHL